MSRFPTFDKSDAVVKSIVRMKGNPQPFNEIIKNAKAFKQQCTRRVRNGSGHEVISGCQRSTFAPLSCCLAYFGEVLRRNFKWRLFKINVSMLSEIKAAPLRRAAEKPRDARCRRYICCMHMIMDLKDEINESDRMCVF